MDEKKIEELANSPVNAALAGERPSAAHTFADAWAIMKARGYAYGGDALENVYFGGAACAW